MQQTATIQVHSANHGNDSRKSKSRYYVIEATFPIVQFTTEYPSYDYNDDPRQQLEIRVSDHWYINGEAYARGGAGKYTRSYLENKTDAVEFAPDWWVLDGSGEIVFTHGRKPTVPQVLKVLKSEVYAAAWLAQYKRGI